MKERSSLRSHWPAAFLLLFILLTLVMSAVYAGSISRLIRDDAQRRVLARSSGQTDQVQEQINRHFSQLELLSTACSSLSGTQERLNGLIRLFSNSADAPLLGLAGPSGQVTFLNGHTAVLQGELRDAVSSGAPQALMSAQLSPDGLNELIYLVPLGGPEDSALLCRERDPFWEDLPADRGEKPLLIRSDGQVILAGRSAGTALNLFQLLDGLGAEQNLEDLAASLAAGQTATLFFSTQRGLMALAAAPLSVSDWYLVSFLDVGESQSALFRALVLGLVIDGLLLLIFLALFLFYRRSQRQHLLQLERAAFVDPVTGGDNQVRFSMRAQVLIGARPPGTYALVSCDIRAFSLINRAFGEAAGNRVLCHLYRCMHQKFRTGELAARVAQDQFILLLFQVSQEDMRQRLEGFARSFNAFNDRLNEPYYLPLTAGICPVSDPSASLDDLCDRANLARKRAKGLTGEQLCSCAFYQPDDRQKLLLNQGISNRMEAALERGDFKVYLQPKVSLATHRVMGAEALVRWLDPEAGFVDPEVFIPVLERNGFITRLDLYMFEQSCLWLRRWADHGLEPVPISVNFSRVNLTRNILPQFQEIQQRWNVPPELLEFEFTETLVGADPQFFAGLTEEIHRCGFHCSIDDFGSGYSSLHMLQRVPADTLKLDKSLFDGLLDPGLRLRSELLIGSVLEMARRLGMTTVAEGISEAEQIRILEQLPCDMVQGYYFSRPLPAEEFQDAFLQKERPE